MLKNVPMLEMDSITAFWTAHSTRAIHFNQLTGCFHHVFLLQNLQIDAVVRPRSKREQARDGKLATEHQMATKWKRNNLDAATRSPLTQ